MISRRNFFARTLQTLGVGFSIPLMQSCAQREIKGQIVGANAKVGHMMRDGKFPVISEEIKTDIVVVGGGASGLSAARFLHKHTSDFTLLELDDATGGNARGGSDGSSAYPWGAHYLPIPGNGDPELLEFLTSCDVITGIRNGLPLFNEFYLCHDPKERLYINNFWQEGLIPQAGLPAKDREQIERFLSVVHDYKEQRGADGKPALTFPVAECSTDKKYVDLDFITAADFLATNGLNSPYLKWYVNYCCADDYGSSIDETSAWAMLHYFSSRRAQAANAPSDGVLTWPEGNQWLTDKLRSGLNKNIKTHHLVFNVSITSGGVEVLCFDVRENVARRIIAQKVILATPQFVNQRLLTTVDRKLDYRAFQYGPWMTANIKTTHSLNERRGEPLSWDNVIYGSDGLGYINAGHQHTNQPGADKIITYYKPLVGDAASARKIAYESNYGHWQQMILDDLSKPHPGLREHVSEMNVWIWGHGMVKPSPGFNNSADRRRAANPIGNKIYFAHSDLSGISVFEEAFYNGHTAAKAALHS